MTLLLLQGYGHKPEGVFGGHDTRYHIDCKTWCERNLTLPLFYQMARVGGNGYIDY